MLKFDDTSIQLTERWVPSVEGQIQHLRSLRIAPTEYIVPYASIASSCISSYLLNVFPSKTRSLRGMQNPYFLHQRNHRLS